MLRFLKVIAFCLIAVQPLAAQISGAVVVGNGVTKDQLDQAKSIVRAAEANKFQWNVGDFEIFQKGEKAKGELLWEVSDPTIVEVKEVPANTRLMVDNGVRAGDTAPKDHDFPPQKDSFWKFKAIKEGTTSILILSVSEDGKRVVVVAKMTVTVGKRKPPPPPPDSPLVKKFRSALATDVAAGKADKNWIDDLAGIFESASKTIPDSVTTIGQLDELLLAARKAAGIPEPEVQLLNLRRAVQQEIYSRLGVDTNSSAVKLTADTRRLAMVAFADISAALMEVR